MTKEEMFAFFHKYFAYNAIFCNRCKNINNVDICGNCIWESIKRKDPILDIPVKFEEKSYENNA